MARQRSNDAFSDRVRKKNGPTKQVRKAVAYRAIRTWEDLDKRIASGRGQGHLDNFLPWLWIRRKNPSGRGNQVTDRMPGYRRASHFFARVEWHVALLCLWLGALDVREQYPLWPMAHPHPLIGFPGSDQELQLPKHPGLMHIARDAGIDHGVEVGSKGVPYVATLDLMVTRILRGTLTVCGISLKPHFDIMYAEPADRMLERLELERRYQLVLKSPYIVCDASLIGPHLAANLESFSSGARLPTELSDKALQQDFALLLDDAARREAISAAIDRVARKMKMSPAQANLLWRNSVWKRRIDVDITREVALHRPLQTSGKAIADALTLQLFGEVA